MIDVDVNQLLPAEMRSSWLVVHRGGMRRTILVCVLLGAAITISFVGVFTGPTAMVLVGPGFILAIQLLNSLVEWPDEVALASLRKERPELADSGTARPPDRASSSSLLAAEIKCAFVLILSACAILSSSAHSHEASMWAIPLGGLSVISGIKNIREARRNAWRRILALTILAIAAGVFAIVLAIRGRAS